jgi:hypothetical protein
MPRHHLIKKSYNRPTKYSMLQEISRNSTADLLQDRLENITYKPGTVLGLLHLMEVLPGCTALCCFTELIIMDVIAGHVVYFDRNVKSMFYVDYKPASQEIISVRV